MSGIVGLFYRDGRPVDRTELTPMVDILAHRGPDGAHVWCEGSVGLGHRMLHTTPESLQERLPFVSATGQLVITADARIDNRDELIPLLGLDDRPSLEVSDSQIILASYEKWGEVCSEKLLGDFAFAIWDSREQTLFCARDHFGIRPFYYYANDHIFAFASEIKALLCLPQVPVDLNEDWIACQLAGIPSDSLDTAYHHICKLPPAQTMTVNSQLIHGQPYWSLDPSFELRLDSNEAYAEAFREIFTDAVRCRLRSSTPVGCTLSGGLDSSSIACVADRLLTQNGGSSLHTFSAVYDDVPECDERPYIEAVLAQGHFIPHFLRGDQVNPFDHIDPYLWHTDEPYYGSNLDVQWKLLEVVNRQGVRVLFDGFDGDSTVSHGYQFLQELATNQRWIALGRQMPRVAATYGISSYNLYWQYLWAHKLGPMINNTRVSRVTWRTYRRLARKLGPSKQTPSAWAQRTGFINPDLIKRTNLYERYRTLQQATSNASSTEREMHYRTLNLSVQPLAAEVLDKTAAAHGIEMRHPFRDKRLVEFCLALPPEQKLDQGWSRMILRRAMTGILPATVQWRLTKTNLAPNVQHGINTFGGEFRDQAATRSFDGMKPYANIATVRAAYARLGTDTSYRDGNELFSVLRVILLDLWTQNVSISHDSARKEPHYYA